LDVCRKQLMVLSRQVLAVAPTVKEGKRCSGSTLRLTS